MSRFFIPARAKNQVLRADSLRRNALLKRYFGSILKCDQALVSFGDVRAYLRLKESVMLGLILMSLICFMLVSCGGSDAASPVIDDTPPVIEIPRP